MRFISGILYLSSGTSHSQPVSNHGTCMQPRTKLILAGAIVLTLALSALWQITSQPSFVPGRFYTLVDVESSGREHRGLFGNGYCVTTFISLYGWLAHRYAVDTRNIWPFGCTPLQRGGYYVRISDDHKSVSIGKLNASIASALTKPDFIQADDLAGTVTYTLRREEVIHNYFPSQGVITK
jgi:hypothetical protein